MSPSTANPGCCWLWPSSLPPSSCLRAAPAPQRLCWSERVTRCFLPHASRTPCSRAVSSHKWFAADIQEEKRQEKTQKPKQIHCATAAAHPGLLLALHLWPQLRWACAYLYWGPRLPRHHPMPKKHLAVLCPFSLSLHILRFTATIIRVLKLCRHHLHLSAPGKSCILPLI